MVDIRAKPRTYMRMRQKKGGDVIAGIYRNRSSRETRVYPLGAPLSSFSWLMAHVSLPLTNRDVAFHQSFYVLMRMLSSPENERG